MTLYIWTGNVNNDFNNPKNWNPSGVPSAGDPIQVADGRVSAAGTFANTRTGLQPLDWRPKEGVSCRSQ
jgi:hypothetical protein